MWDWHWWHCLLPTALQRQPNQSLLLPTTEQNDAVSTNYISFAFVARMLTSWLNRRCRRYLLLIICCPFLLPLFCAMCPLICVMELCFLMCWKRWKAAGYGGGRRRRSADGGDEVGLLQRYLEDQLMLVVGSVYDCGDDDENVGEEDGVDLQYFENARPLLQ